VRESAKIAAGLPCPHSLRLWFRRELILPPLFLLKLILCLAVLLVKSSGATLDLKDAIVVAPSDLSGPEKRAVSMLIDEVEKRTRVR